LSEVARGALLRDLVQEALVGIEILWSLDDGGEEFLVERAILQGHGDDLRLDDVVHQVFSAGSGDRGFEFLLRIGGPPAELRGSGTDERATQRVRRVPHERVVERVRAIGERGHVRQVGERVHVVAIEPDVTAPRVSRPEQRGHVLLGVIELLQVSGPRRETLLHVSLGAAVVVFPKRQVSERELARTAIRHASAKAVALGVRLVVLRQRLLHAIFHEAEAERRVRARKERPKVGVVLSDLEEPFQRRDGRGHRFFRELGVLVALNGGGRATDDFDGGSRGEIRETAARREAENDER
jgi:hypothetical protein